MVWRPWRLRLHADASPLVPSLIAALLLVLLGTWLGSSATAGEVDSFAAQGFVHFQQEPIAPDFTLVDHEGTPRSLHDFKGQVVLLTFWATW
ncbi:MAG: redoxin domain-containing protein [Nitrospinae bacterium]|nr:redoxin domain-containing protein [Nitrospinota bacterium]